MQTAVIVNPASGQPLPLSSAAGGATTRAVLGTNVQCGTAAGAVTVRVPLNPSDGSCFAVEDAGANAGANNITVDGAGVLIDGAAQAVVDLNGAFAFFMWDRGQWRRLSPRRRLDPPSGPGGALLIELLADAADVPGEVSKVTAAAPITSTGGATPLIGITPATTLAAGSLSAADKTKLDGLPAAPVTSVGAAAPVTSSGGVTPQIGITAATTVAAGSLSAADKTKLDGLQPQGASTVIGSATPNIDWSLGGTFVVTLVAATPCVMSFSNTADGRLVIVKVIGNAAASFALPAGIQWAGGTVPTPTLNGVDVYTFVRIGAIITGSCLTDTH